MRNHQQTDPEDATIAKLGDATFERIDIHDNTWIDTGSNRTLYTDTLIRYGATFWKKIVPEPGYRLVEDHERVGEKPKGCRVLCKDGSWNISYAVEWVNNDTYAVPIKQVVARRATDTIPDCLPMFAAWFATEELRDRAVRDANEREER